MAVASRRLEERDAVGKALAAGFEMARDAGHAAPGLGEAVWELLVEAAWVGRRLGDADARFRQPLHAVWPAIGQSEEEALAVGFSRAATGMLGGDVVALRPTPEQIDRAAMVEGWYGWVEVDARRTHRRVVVQAVAALAAGHRAVDVAKAAGKDRQTVSRWKTMVIETIARRLKNRVANVANYGYR